MATMTEEKPETATAAKADFTPHEPEQREYIVLRQVDEKFSAWEIAVRKRARSDTHAVRLVAEEQGDGVYVAVPSSQWRERTVKTETVKKIVNLS